MLKFYTLLLPLLIKPTRMGQWAEKMEYKHNQIGLAIFGMHNDHTEREEWRHNVGDCENSILTI